MLTLEPHPLLDAVVFTTRFPAPLEALPTPPAVAGLLRLDATAPFHPDDAVREAVRRLLRHGGFKPSGRSKPASESLVKAIQEGRLGPEQGINLAVDVCNAVSLHSGLPVSVLDADRALPPWSMATCPPGTSYVFNPSGQVIDVGGLVMFHDGQGPCGGPVKDAQRTKTHGGTVHTVSMVWGTRELPGRAEQVAHWYRALLEQAGARTASG